MTSVRQILRSKGPDVLSADPSLAVRDALRLMERNNIGSLLVVQDGRLVGLFTERDFARHVAASGASSLEGVVGDVMTKEVLVVSPDTPCDDCMALMTEKRTRHLPVLENDEVVGIVSIGDIVKGLIDDKEFVIEQLERYITGR
jgi:CBS domain-containing protein